MRVILQLDNNLLQKLSEFKETRSISLAVEIVDSLIKDIK
jgi:hypothetical protein